MKDRREYMREYMRTRYRNDPEFREKRKAAQREQSQRPEFTARVKAWRSRPEVKLRQKLKRFGVPEDQIAIEIANLSRVAD